jgi:guanylate kinase
MTSVFIISAPSGSGKTTLVERLLRDVPELHFSVSYTTRPPRGQERNGKQYYFVTLDQFREMIARNEFLEHAEVFGNYYGTARHFLDDAARAGKDLLLDIDVQGARQVKQELPDAVSIFILPPSREKLEWRLRHRGEDSEEVIRKRLLDAGREVYGYEQYDYILINDQLESSAERLKAIVLTERRRRRGHAGDDAEAEKTASIAETCRKEKVQTQVDPILASFGG